MYSKSHRVQAIPLTPGNYWFFIDTEGHRQDRPLEEAIAALRRNPEN